MILSSLTRGKKKIHSHAQLGSLPAVVVFWNMKSGISIWLGMGMLLCCFLLGCGKIIAPVDTYGFKQAFDEQTEPQAGSQAIGEVSVKLAEDVLDAVRSNDLTGTSQT